MKRRIIFIAVLVSLSLLGCAERNDSAWSPPDAPWRKALAAADSTAAAASADGASTENDKGSHDGEANASQAQEEAPTGTGH